MNDRRALLATGITAMLTAIAGSAEAADIRCFVGTWRGKAVENLPAGSELMGGNTVVETWARDMQLEIAADRLEVRHPDLQIETPLTPVSQSGQRMRVRLGQPQNFFSGEREELLFEVLGPRLIRVDLVEGQPFVFQRVSGAPPTSLCSAAKAGSGSDALSKLYRGRWVFDTLPGHEDKLAKKPALAEMFRTFELEIGPSELTARIGGQRQTSPYERAGSSGSSVVIETEHPAFDGSFGHAVRLGLESQGPNVLRVHLLDESGKTFQFKRPGAGTATPAAPARKEEGRAGGGNPNRIVPCDVNGKIVFKHAHRCPKPAQGG